MTVFDQFFFTMFSFYKKRYKQKANAIALFYTSFLQISVAFLLGCFFAAFFSQMHVDSMSSEKAWTIFVLIAIGIHFKNWLKYSGKTRKVLNAKWNKRKPPQQNIVLLCCLPFVAIGLALIMLKSL